jgi:hypothetical protein
VKRKHTALPCAQLSIQGTVFHPMLTDLASNPTIGTRIQGASFGWDCDPVGVRAARRRVRSMQIVFTVSVSASLHPTATNAGAGGRSLCGLQCDKAASGRFESMRYDARQDKMECHCRVYFRIFLRRIKSFCPLRGRESVGLSRRPPDGQG